MFFLLVCYCCLYYNPFLFFVNSFNTNIIIIVFLYLSIAWRRLAVGGELPGGGWRLKVQCARWRLAGAAVASLIFRAAWRFLVSGFVFIFLLTTTPLALKSPPRFWFRTLIQEKNEVAKSLQTSER